MKSSIFLLLFTCILMSGRLHAQSWYDMMKDKNRYTLKQIEQSYERERRIQEKKNRKYEDSNKKEKDKDQYKRNKSEEDESGESDAIFNRFKWFWEKRVGKNGNFPDEDRAFREWKEFEQSTSSKVGKSVSNTAGFTSLGPFNTSGESMGIGHMDQIAFHPTNPNIFYAVSNGSHLWKTTDGGQSYTSLTDQLPAMYIYKVVVDIANPNRILFTQNQINAVYQSLDAGATWTTINTPTRFYDNFIQNPGNPTQWFATAGNQFYRSNDNAVTWSVIGANTSVEDGNAYMHNLTLKPGANGNVMYCTGGNDPIKFYRSENAGITWSLVATWAGTRDARLAVCPTSPNLIIACTAQYAAMDGIYKSTDGGLSFNKIYNADASTNLFSYNYPPNGFDGQAFWGFVYEINPQNPNQHFCGCINNWRSDDGGLTWHIISLGNTMYGSTLPVTHADKHFLKFNPYSPSKLYDCNDGGINRSTDNGVSWSGISNSLVTTQIYKVSTPPVNRADKYTVIGTQDNGVKIKPAGGLWFDRIGGDGMDNAIDPLYPNTCYVSWQYGNFIRSDDAGDNFNTYITPGGLQGGWVTPIVLDTSFLSSTSRPSRVFIAFRDRVVKSVDKGATWTFLPNGFAPLFPTLLNVADSQTLIVGSYDQLWRTTNNGTSWANITTSITQFHMFSSIVTDPHNFNRIWVTSSSLGSNGVVYYTSNGGGTWTDISYNLPYGTYNSMTIDFSSPEENMYISSDNGIASKVRAATSWATYGTGLPYVGIDEIQLDRSNNTLAVATYGRGLWSVPLMGGEGITLAGKAFLQGAYNPVSGLMNTTLNHDGILQASALTQPYNNTNFNYAGTETVAADFFSSNPNIVDWVLVELRDTVAPSTVVAKRAAFVKNDGTLADIDGVTNLITFPGIAAGSYYVAVRHRNHLGIRSSLPVNFSSGKASYDFSAESTLSYQNKAYTSTVPLGSIWAMRAGNANSNETVKYTGPDNDQDRILNTKLGGLLSRILTSQYAAEDINMDGIVKANGPDNDQNFLLNILLNGLLSTIYTEQL